MTPFARSIKRSASQGSRKALRRSFPRAPRVNPFSFSLSFSFSPQSLPRSPPCRILLAGTIKHRIRPLGSGPIGVGSQKEQASHVEPTIDARFSLRSNGQSHRLQSFSSQSRLVVVASHSPQHPTYYLDDGMVPLRQRAIKHRYSSGGGWGIGARHAQTAGAGRHRNRAL